MSFFDKVGPAIDRQLSSTKKTASLNPHAAEFVPSSLRSSSGKTSIVEGATSLRISGKSDLKRSESSISNQSDEEFNLPDDIIDFNVIEEDASQAINNIPFANLSLHEGDQTSRVSTGSSFFPKEQLVPHGANGSTFSDNIRRAVPSFGEHAISGSFLNASAKPWNKQTLNRNQFFSNGSSYNDNSTQGLVNEAALPNNTEMNPIDFLVSQFPGFSSESLVEVYFANGSDLNRTIEMLTQLELRADGGLNQNINSKALSAPNLGPNHFPGLSIQEGLNNLPNYGPNGIQQTPTSYQIPNKDNLLMLNPNSSILPRGALDFAPALGKMPPQDGGSIWKYEGKGSVDASVGSSRSSHVLASSYNGGQGRSIYNGGVQRQITSRASPTWLDTGDAMANMFNEMREEAREHACLRNAYLEQARQAYSIGNKALARELSVKGQLHNMHMKAAHTRAQESFYRQRNAVGPQVQGGNNGRVQERMIDLQGLHVSEAIHVLKRELTMLRAAARSADHRLHIYICLGAGHHTHDSRLPVVVQRYLLEEEGLDYTEPQPGMLRVLLY